MFRIIYEDQNILAIDKPENILTIPGFKPDKKSVLSILKEKGFGNIFVVHRLDKAVSGILIFAKNKNFHRYLNYMFEKRLIEKCYFAIVHGQVRDKHGIINVPIRQYGSGRMGVDTKKGKESITRYKTLLVKEKWSALDVRPVTGRKHQIRVHLYHIGHPILGDRLYGDIGKSKAYPRLMLHSYRMKIPLQNGSYLNLKSSLPQIFRDMLRKS